MRLLPLAVLVAVLAACDGSGEAVSTPAPSSTPVETGVTDTTFGTPDFDHIDPQSAADFEAGSARLQADLVAIVACIREGDTDCINDKRADFKAEFAAAEDRWNSIGPESRGNACYRRLMDYGKYLSALDTASEVMFAAAEAGQAAAFRGFANEANQLQQDHRDVTARVLAACT
jgi:hypothetical protein